MTGEVKDYLQVKDEITTKKLNVASTITVADVEANGSVATTISSLGPSGIGTTTITKWLKITQGGVIYYIPMWT